MPESRKGDRLLRDRDIAELFDVTERTVRHWRQKGALPTVRTPSGQPRTPYVALKQPYRYGTEEGK